MLLPFAGVAIQCIGEQRDLSSVRFRDDFQSQSIRKKQEKKGFHLDIAIARPCSRVISHLQLLISL